MTNIITILKGLPASGKSTWAKEQARKTGAKRICKDDLRAMIDDSVYSKDRERMIISSRNALIRHFMVMCEDIIIDDTNLNPIHIKEIKEIAYEYLYEVKIKEFDTPLAECISRDSGREKSVGEKVIVDMYNRWLRKEEYEVVDFIHGLPEAIICDIDGTLAHMDGRSPYDESGVLSDKPDDQIIKLVNFLSGDRKIILMSGRHDSCKGDTVEWLGNHGVIYDKLFMRKTGDDRKDWIIKYELFNENIRGKYNVSFVLDDRNRVVDMWRRIGLKCLQVAPGDF